jgi:hypothetical protein
LREGATAVESVSLILASSEVDDDFEDDDQMGDLATARVCPALATAILTYATPFGDDG